MQMRKWMAAPHQAHSENRKHSMWRKQPSAMRTDNMQTKLYIIPKAKWFSHILLIALHP
jgi:hypothetical protein